MRRRSVEIAYLLKSLAVTVVVGLLWSTVAPVVPAALGAGVTTAASRTAGVGFAMARLRYGGGGDWYSNPSSLPNLMNAVRSRTGIPVEGNDEIKLTPTDEDLFNHPIVYMNGHGEVKFTEAEVEALRKYLDGGGFLWADDNYGMDVSFRREMRRVFPESPLVEIPFDHPIYHAFYDLPGLPKVHEHDGKPAQGFGVFRNGRMVAFYSYQSDIGDGLEDTEVHADPTNVREAAMKMGVNIVVFAMTH